MDCGEIFRRLGAFYPERPVAHFGEETLTGAQLYERGTRLVNALLDLGVAPQDRVATLGPNARRSLEEIGGLALGGFTRVPLHFGAASGVIHHMLADSQAKVLITDRAAYEAIRSDLGPLPDLAHVIVADDSGESPYDEWLTGASPVDPHVTVTASDMIQLGYTGGTTGQPKGAIQTHGSWVRVTIENLLALPPVNPNDGYLAAGPLFGAAGSYLFSVWTRGTPTYVADDFSPAALARLARTHRPTSALMLPPVIEALLAADIDDADLSSLDIILTMGAALRIPAIQDLTRRLGDVLTIVYGQSEALPATMLRPADIRLAVDSDPELLASSGRPTPTSRVMVIDQQGKPLPPDELGEIVVDTPGNMVGYWRAPQATAEKMMPNGMVRTGDVGFIDRRGFVFVAARSDDIVRTTDGVVVPQRLERLLERHPGVAEAAVVGLQLGNDAECQIPRAVVHLHEGSSVSGAQLLGWAHTQGTLPADLTIVVQEAELAKSHVGKLLRRVVRDQQALVL